jgi:hypothetical protein
VDDLTIAQQFINLFRVDALYPASDDTSVCEFIARFPYLPWPLLHKELFIDGLSGKVPTLLDLYHPVRHIYEEHVKNLPAPKLSSTLFEWDAADPLDNVFLATFGGFPTKEEIGLDYRTLLEKYLAGRRVVLEAGQPLPSDAYKSLTPSALTAYDLLRSRLSGWDNPGFYVGNAQDFTDLVNFWNLRASDIDLLFYDPTHAKRLGSLRDAYLTALRNWPNHPREMENLIAIWCKSYENNTDISIFGSNIVKCVAGPTIWNGLNVKPPIMHFEEQSVLGSVTDDGGTPYVSFQLPDKPFFDDIQLHTQHVVVSVRPLVDITKHEDRTFQIPFIPELNEYFGRKCYFIWDAARAEVDGLGIIIEVTRGHLTLHALESRSLITKIFEAFGMNAKPSQPGLIASRLIQQMGGLQGCRVFKIAGVRKLIEKYSPYQSFTKSAAVQIIGQNDPKTGEPNFSEYENLFIEYRESGKLRPEDAFTYLVKKGVFRVGLKFECPNCQLEFWLPLDDVRTLVKCEYCGNEFNVTPQLRDRDWAYRRSGLFGRDDHQEGGIPVALTLQQLDTVLRMQSMIYTTAMNITPVTAPINSCETDLVVITRSYDGHVQLLIGECKTREEINDQDVANMKKVADAFPKERFEVFIVFAKLSHFTSEEIERCRVSQDQYRYRVILLCERELEPYFVYERTAQEFDINKTAVSLEDFAKNTHDIYFDPKQRDR